jgi:hypothetical protein
MTSDMNLYSGVNKITLANYAGQVSQARLDGLALSPFWNMLRMSGTILVAFLAMLAVIATERPIGLNTERVASVMRKQNTQASQNQRLLSAEAGEPISNPKKLVLAGRE